MSKVAKDALTASVDKGFERVEAAGKAEVERKEAEARGQAEAERAAKLEERERALEARERAQEERAANIRQQEERLAQQQRGTNADVVRLAFDALGDSVVPSLRATYEPLAAFLRETDAKIQVGGVEESAYEAFMSALKTHGALLITTAEVADTSAAKPATIATPKGAYMDTKAAIEKVMKEERIESAAEAYAVAVEKGYVEKPAPSTE